MSETVSEAGASSIGNISVEHEDKVTKLLQNISLLNENAASSEEVVLMVGGTRAGKSTTRLLLRNRDDLSQLKAYGNPACICDNGDGEIGNFDGSSTTIGVKDFKVHETTWVDTYGFAGNTGPYEEIFGIYSLNRVANQAKRLKFLVFIPIAAFYGNANRRSRTDTFDHAMQLIKNVTTSSAVGLVVTMVENIEPWNKDEYVKNEVLKRLNVDRKNLTDELQKVVSEQHPTILTVLENVINHKLVFVIRRPPKPHNVEEMQLHEFLTNSNGTSSPPIPVYKKVCEDLIRFCNGLKYAELQGQCVGKLSAETENKLIKEIYPRILSEVNKFVNQLLELLIKQIKDSIQEKTEKNKNVELFNELSGLISEISVFSDPECNPRSYLPSGVIERVVKIVGAQNEAIFDLIERLKISENQFIALQKFTNVTHHNGFSSFEFQKVLKFLQSTHLQIFETHKKDLPSAIINNIREEINAHVINIKCLYLERLDMWKKTPGHLLLSKYKLHEHIKKVNIELGYKNTLAKTTSQISFLYATLDVAIIKSTEESLSQLKVLIKNYAKAREMYKHYQLPDIQELEKKPAIQIQSFLSEQLNNIQESSANLSGTKLIRDLENMCLLWKEKLLSEKILDMNLENLSTNIQFLKNVVNCFEEYSLIQDTNSDTLDHEIRKLSICFNRTNIPDIQSYWYHEECETHDLEAVLVESWFTNVSSLKDDLNGVYTRFKYLFDLKQVVFNSVDVRNNTATLMSESTNCANCLEGLYKTKDMFYSRLDSNVTDQRQELQIYNQDMQTIFSNITLFCESVDLILNLFVENISDLIDEHETDSLKFEKCIGIINKLAMDFCQFMKVLYRKSLEEIQNNNETSQTSLIVVQLLCASEAFQMLFNKFDATYLRTDTRNVFGRIDDITRYWTERVSINNEICPYCVLEKLKAFSEQSTSSIISLLDNSLVLENVPLQTELQSACETLTTINAELNQIIPGFMQELPNLPDHFLSYLQAEHSVENCILSEIFSLSTSIFTQTHGNTLLVLSAASLNVSDLYKRNIFPVDNTIINNIFILVKENIFVDTNIIEDGDVQNFLLAAENIICTSNFTISFKANPGNSFRTGAQAGESPGGDGHHGDNGENGAQGCNICILTQNVLECQSLSIVTKGGDASDGQDGGDGAHGLDDNKYSSKLYNKVYMCLHEFDSLLKQLCQSVGMEVPELAGRQRENEQRTPNVQLSSAVFQRVCIFAGVYYAVDCAMNVICDQANHDPEMCICRLLEFIMQSIESIDTAEILYLSELKEMAKLGPCSISENVSVCVSFLKLVSKLCNSSYHVNWRSLLEPDLFYCKSGIIVSAELEKIAWAAVCGLYMLAEGKEHPLVIERRSGSTNGLGYFLAAPILIVAVTTPLLPVLPVTYVLLNMPAHQPATQGGAGGNGGDGGNGGCPGFISLNNSVEKEGTVPVLRIHGNGGKAGNGGKVGTAGCSKHPPVGEEKSNGKTGVDNSGRKCTGNCDNFQEMENNMANVLSNTLLSLSNDMEDLSTKILLKHDWPFKFPVFTVNCLLDMCLGRITLYPKTILFSQDRLDYEYGFQKLCEKLLQTSNFDSADSSFLPNVMACSYKISEVIHKHIHSPQIVVDLKKYLKCCADTIKNLMESKQLFTLTSCHQKFRKNLQEDINKTKHIIRDNVLPQLSKVKSMFLQQIRQHKNDLNTCLSILNEAQKFESVLKFVSCLQWLTSKAEESKATKVVTAGLAGVAWLVTALKPSLSPPAAIQGNPLLNQERLQAEIKYLLEDYIKQIQKIVKKHPEFKNIFAAFLDKLKTLYNNFKACESEAQNDGKLSEYFCQFYELQTEICEAITKHREQYSEQIDQAHALGVLYIELGVSRANCELYNQTKATLLNRIKSLFSNSEIRGAENRIELSETIYAPKLKFFLGFIENELAADSYSGSRYWKLKDVLVTLKHNLHSFTEGLPSEKEFELCFIKLEQALEQYSDLWKSIESTSEQIKLADFIAASRMIDELEETDANSELSCKVIKMKMLTRAQLVLLEYQDATIAIKQWAFPYAEKYRNITHRNALHISQLYSQNNEDIKIELKKEANACAQLLEEFKTSFNFEQAIHTREDEIWTTEHFYQDKSPFYEWDSAKFPIEIRKLLVGFPVKLCAKLNENHAGKGAIKTNNTIRLQFRHEDGAEYQTELDNCLKQFNLHMTHDGNSFYKVDGDVYKNSHNQLTFVDNAVSGKDVSENNSRSKTKDYLLSPFTQWTFQLVLCEPSLLHNPKSVFTELADKFGHRLVLQLVGTGIYLNEASARWNELKPKNVHSHYQQISDYQSE